MRTPLGILLFINRKLFSRADVANNKILILLTLSPTAEQNTGIGLRRLQKMTIVAGMYACRWVLSPVPVYEVSVCKWGGAPCTHSTFTEMAPGPVRVAGTMERSDI